MRRQSHPRQIRGYASKQPLGVPTTPVGGKPFHSRKALLIAGFLTVVAGLVALAGAGGDWQ